MQLRATALHCKAKGKRFLGSPSSFYFGRDPPSFPRATLKEISNSFWCTTKPCLCHCSPDTERFHLPQHREIHPRASQALPQLSAELCWVPDKVWPPQGTCRVSPNHCVPGTRTVAPHSKESFREMKSRSLWRDAPFPKGSSLEAARQQDETRPKQRSFATARPNASPQDNCHSLSLKHRYKALCLSQLPCSLTSCAWVLNTENTELLKNNNLCSNSWRKSSTKYYISQPKKISHTSKQEATLGPWKRNKTNFWGCLQSQD